MMAVVHHCGMQSPFGETFRTWRLKQRLSQRELSELAAVPQSEISKIETDKRLNFTILQWGRLFTALKLSPEQRKNAWELLDRSTCLAAIEQAEQAAA